jgi:hypothetical protein
MIRDLVSFADLDIFVDGSFRERMRLEGVVRRVGSGKMGDGEE